VKELLGIINSLTVDRVRTHFAATSFFLLQMRMATARFLM